METNSLPKVISVDKKPIDGNFEKKFSFCENNFNNKCTEYYKSIKGKEGIHTCPYGFTSVNAKVNSKEVIYTSIEVDKFSNRKSTKKHKKKDVNKKRFSKEEIEKIIIWESNLQANFTAKKNILRDYDKNVLKVSQKKEVLDDTLHELRKLNNVLKKQAFLLKSELTKDSPSSLEIKNRSKNIYATSQLVSARLNAYDFTLNPEIIETNPPAKISFYRKFEKARHCLEVITSDLDIPIIFTGNSNSLHTCFDIVDVLPFILFENAIKFNYKNNPIECIFNESNGCLNEIIIKNKAVLPNSEELSELKTKHYRSKAADSISGTGKGLFIANLICEYHNVSLDIDTKIEKKEDNKDIGDFIVKLKTTNANITYT